MKNFCHEKQCGVVTNSKNWLKVITNFCFVDVQFQGVWVTRKGKSLGKNTLILKQQYW